MIAFSSKRNIDVQPYLDHLIWMASSGKRSPHPHGWGYFLIDSSGFASVVRSSKPIFIDSPKTEFRAKIGLLHARKASKGTRIDQDRVHPYIVYNGKIHVLIHNGGIEDEFDSPSTGVDTEYILRTVVKLGVERAYCELSKLESSSLTLVYFNGDEMFILKHRTKLPDYYTLFYRVHDDVFEVSSEPIGNGWSEMENGEIMRIKDGEIVEKYVVRCS